MARTSARVFLKLAADRLYMPPAVTLATRAKRSGLVPFRPLAGTVLVTHGCNFRCRMCAFGRGVHPTGELTTEEIKSVVRQFRELDFAYCTFSGGEPLLRKDLAELCNEAHRLGFPNIQVTTNGSLMTEARAIELIEAGMNSVSVSLDGYGDTHSEQRNVPGAWEKTTAAIRLLARLRDTRFPDLTLDLPMVLSHLNFRQVPALLELCEEVGATLTLQFLERSSFFTSEHDDAKISFDPDPAAVDEMITELHRLIGHRRMTALISHHALDYIGRYLKREDLGGAGVPCAVGFMMVYVDALGRVYTGCFAMPSVGNVRERSLAELVKTERNKQNLDDMLQMNCPTCPNGFIFSTWYNVPAMAREIGYRVKKKAGLGA